MYVLLGTLDLVLPSNLVAGLRTHLSRQPLLALYEKTLRVLSMVTDLSTYPERYFADDGPFASVLPQSLVAYLYDGASNVPGTVFFFFVFIFERFLLSNYILVFGQPIGFRPSAMSNWLTHSKVALTKALRLFKQNFLVQHVQNPLFAVPRLPDVYMAVDFNARYLPESPAERYFSDLYVTQLDPSTSRTYDCPCTTDKP